MVSNHSIKKMAAQPTIFTINKNGKDAEEERKNNTRSVLNKVAVRITPVAIATRLTMIFAGE